MEKFKNIINGIRYHGKILLRGFVKVTAGAITACLIAVSVYGYCVVPTEGGYMAVCDFVGATAGAVMALCSMYAAGRKKGAKK